MEIIERRFEFRRGQSFRIYYVADQHIGNAGADLKRMKEDVKQILDDPHAYWIQGGDAIDAVVPSDKKRFDPDTVVSRLDNVVLDQIKTFEETYEPIADRCLGILRGNHEEQIRLRHHVNVLEGLCLKWNVPSLGDTAFIRLVFSRGKNGASGSSSIILFAAHSNVAGRSGGAKVSRLETLLGYFDADIYMIAHGHKKVSHVSTLLSMAKEGKPRLITKKKIGVMTGSYLRSYQKGISTYAEKGLYPPSDLGAIAVTIDPERRDYRVYT